MFIATRKNPNGPSLSKLEKHIIELSGSIITFEAPCHNHSLISERDNLNLSFNIYDGNGYDFKDKSDKDEPPVRGLVTKDWQYRGLPIMDGVIGSVIYRTSVTNLAPFSSLFHPRHLECGIERYIYAASEINHHSGRNRYEWNVVTINDVEWVNYISKGWAGLHNAEEVYTSLWQTPITDQHLFTVQFKLIFRKPRTRLKDIYSKLIETVMNSFEITLSPDAQAQKDAVKATYPDIALAEYMPPYEFETLKVKDRFELNREVSARNGNDSSFQYEEHKKIVDEEMKKQKQKAKEVRERVLASHLRFKYE